MKTFHEWMRDTQNVPDWHDLFKVWTHALTNDPLTAKCNGNRVGAGVVQTEANQYYGSEDDCPVCGESPEWTCRCSLRDSGCKNGHNWHHCPTHKVKVEGKSDHTGRRACTCHVVI